jgi:MoaA/NifB/PqqE/SkfB family radical SAM enzyme
MRVLSADLREELQWEYVRFQLDGMLERGLKRLPEAPPEPVRELHLELTHRCNLSCVMCEHWEIEHLDPDSVRRELDFESLKKIIDAAVLLKDIHTIVITGGEPWLRHDFNDVVAWLSGRFPDASIIALTNFWNTGHLRGKLADLRARGVKNLKLGSSIDGLEKTHNAIRGQDTSFQGIERSVRALREEFPEYPFGFTFTILPQNAPELYDTYRFVVDDLKCGLGAQWVVETGGIEPIRWTKETREAGIEQVERIARDIAAKHGAVAELQNGGDLRERGWLWSELLYWRYLAEYGRDPRRFPFFKRCTAGERHVMLDPEGEVFFCPVNRAKTIGNAARTPLDELWKSGAAEELRRYVDSCQCHCWLRCVSTPAVDRLLRLALAP